MAPYNRYFRSLWEEFPDWKRQFPVALPDSNFPSDSDNQWTIAFESTSSFDLFFNISDPSNSSSSVLSVFDDPTAGTDGTRPQYWTLLLLVFPVLTAAGNGLVCASVFLERNLKTVTNYFIASLAIADILVALLVMPLAVYVEVNNSDWELGDALCDTWIACDVMSCTASILNLTAISIDRFTAVTRPIAYARHRKSRRVYAMLAVPWLISVAISSPIALGLNYTEKRAETPKLCTFYNSDFLIYSSMGSFYIPCLVMTGLYGRIYLAIRTRTRGALRRSQGGYPRERKAPVKVKRFGPMKQSVVLEEPSGYSISEGVDQQGQGRLVRFGVSDISASYADLSPDPDVLDSSPQSDRTPDYVIPGSTLIGGAVKQTSNCVAAGCDNLLNACVTSRHFNGIGEGHPALEKRLSSPGTSGLTPSDLESRENASVYVSSADDELPVSPGEGQRWVDPYRRSSNHLNVDQGKKFKFKSRSNRTTSGVKRNRRAARRERKATKTLAIVLGVFLFCWMPFFTVNIINAFCLRYDFEVLRQNRLCQIESWLLSFLVWLGYINSFLNPIIYTIFNAEFRRAFRKILCQIF